MESDHLDHDPMRINIYAEHSSNMIVKSLVPVIEFRHVSLGYPKHNSISYKPDTNSQSHSLGLKTI